MIESRVQNTINNILSSVFLQIINMLVGFLIPQIFLHQYGSSYYGLISSIQQILSYFTIFEAGIGMASIQTLYKLLDNKDYDNINALLVNTKKYYNKAALCYGISLLIMAFIYPLVVKDQVNPLTVFFLVIVMGSSTFIEYSIQGKYRVLLTADQKLSTLNHFIVVSQAVGLIIRILLIYLNYDIVIVQASLTIIYLLRALTLGIYVRKKYFYVKYNYNAPKVKLYQRNAVLLQQISGLVVYNLPTVLLTLFTNLKIVSLYAVYNFVFSSLYSILTNTFSTASTASFGNICAKGDLKALRQTYSLYEYGYYCLITIVFTVTSVMLLPFVNLYTKGVNDIQYIDYKLALLFIIIGILNNIRVPMITMINAAGHFEQTKYRALLEASINFFVSFILVFYFGIYGVLYGTIASFLYRVPDMIIYSNRSILKQSIARTLKRIIIFFIIGIILYSISNKILLFVCPIINSWFKWMLISVIFMLLISFIVIITSFILEPHTCKQLFNKLRFFKRRDKLNV